MEYDSIDKIAKAAIKLGCEYVLNQSQIRPIGICMACDISIHLVLTDNDIFLDDQEIDLEIEASQRISDMLIDIFPEWPQFSGDVLYPIPSFLDDVNEMHAFTFSSEQPPAYHNARKNLANFILYTLEKESCQ